MIRSGEADIFIAGGMESMSNAPYLLPKAREGLRLGDGKIVDSMILDGLWDAFKNIHMGSCAEMCVREYKLSREAQDAFTVESYRRALQAEEKGMFQEEIVPVTAQVCVTIPVGTYFQFRATGKESLVAVGITMPPWPGDREVYYVSGPWLSDLFGP